MRSYQRQRGQKLPGGRGKSKHISDVEVRERQDALTRLGFRTYGDYLKSDLWKGIRLRVMRRDQMQCRRCGREATQVHHSRYDIAVLRGDTIAGLYATCGACIVSVGHGGGYARALDRKLPELDDSWWVRQHMKQADIVRSVARSSTEMLNRLLESDIATKRMKRIAQAAIEQRRPKGGIAQ